MTISAMPATQAGPTVKSVDLASFPPIMIAVPTVPWMWTDSAAAIMQLIEHVPPGSMLHQVGHGTSSIAEKRNGIAATFMALAPKHGFGALLWLDSDMVPHPATAARLLYGARETGADLFSAFYVSRTPPFLGEVYYLPEDEPRRHLLPPVCEVARAGFGCMLMQRRVLEVMPQPWFAYPHTDRPGVDEDFYHCDKARALGLRIFMDFALECGHLSTVAMNRALARAYQATPQGQAEMAARDAFRAARAERGLAS